jgi:Uma2 family endonuclease
MAMPVLEPRQWTVEAIHALPYDGNRYECIDGELFVSPAPTARHQRALLELAVALKGYVEVQHQLGWVWIAPFDVVLGPRTLVQPDVRVHSAGPRASAEQRAARSMLISEVLSPSTARADRYDKRRLYLREATDRYWIIDLASEIVEVWTADHERPEIVHDVLTWLPQGASAPFTLSLREFFADANAWEQLPTVSPQRGSDAPVDER